MPVLRCDVRELITSQIYDIYRVLQALKQLFFCLAARILAKYMICKGLRVPKFFYTLAFFRFNIYALLLNVCPLVYSQMSNPPARVCNHSFAVYHNIY
jgi:hypothetical protein